MNNEQFRKSVTTKISNALQFYSNELKLAEQKLKENPRAVWAKEGFAVSLSVYQTYQSLNNHITNGNFDDKEYYNQYINPKSESQIRLKSVYSTNL